MKLFIPAALILALAGCQQTTGSSKDIRGATVNYSSWPALSDGDSIVTFSGKKAPFVMLRQQRLRDNSIYAERIRFENDTKIPGFPGHLYLESAPSYFNNQSAENLLNKPDVLRRAKRRFKTLSWFSPVKTADHYEGKFSYLIAAKSATAPDKCIFARQGFNDIPTEVYGIHYQTLTSFGYCKSNSTEAELLEVLATVRVKQL